MWVSRAEWKRTLERIQKLEERVGAAESRCSPFKLNTGQETYVYGGLSFHGLRSFVYEDLEIKDAVKKLAAAIGYEFVAKPSKPSEVVLEKLPKAK